MAEREVGIRLTAEDDASEKIEDVADALEEISEDAVEVEVDAETRDAERAIDKFAREIEDLTDDSKELRIEFREQQLKRQINGILRQLDKVEDDPVEIEVKSKELESARQDLEDLRDLAKKEINFEIDASADGIRAARAQADDLIEAGDRYQSLGSAVRGVSDEIGFASEGINSFAVGALDAGDVAVQLGEKFGLSAAAAGRLASVLGGAGIAAVIAGTAIPAIIQLAQSLGGDGGLSQETEDAISNLNELAGVLDQFQTFIEGSSQEGLIAAFLGDEDDEQIQKVIESFGKLGLSIEELPAVLRDSATAQDEYLKSALAAQGVDEENIDLIARMARETDDFGQIRAKAFKEGGLDARDFVDANEDIIRSFQEIENVAQDVDVEIASETALRNAGVFSDTARELIQQAEQSGTSWEAAFQKYLNSSRDAEDAAESVAAAEKAREDRLARTAEQLEEVAEKERAAAEATLEGAQATLEAADARRAAADAGFAVTKAQNDFNESLVETTIALSGGNDEIDAIAAGTAEFDEALIGVTEDAAKLADEQVRLASESAAARGETLSQADATAEWNRSMADAASEASGPLRKAIIDYIAEVNGIPPKKVSEIEALLDEGKVAEAERRINNTSRTRRAQIDAAADTAAAERALNEVARTRTAQIIASNTGTGGPGDPNNTLGAITNNYALTGVRARQIERERARWVLRNGRGEW